MKTARKGPRRRRRREAPRESYIEYWRGRARAGGTGRRRLFGSPIGFAEVDRDDQEEAGWAHPTVAGSEALRNLRVCRRQPTLAVPTAGSELGQRAELTAQLAAQPRILGRFFARHLEDGGDLQGRRQFLWAGAIQRRPRAQGSTGQLPGAERRQSDRNNRRKNQPGRNHSGWSRRLYRATGLVGIGQLKPQGDESMIRTRIRTAMMGAMAVVALTAAGITAQAADPVQLQSLDVQTLSGQQVQLKLHMSGPAPEPLPFTIDKPARIAFDLPNTTLALASRRFDVRSGGVDTVLAAEANGRARVVVNVDSLMPYTTKVDGNMIVVTLGQQPGADVGKPVAARAASSPGAPAERAIRTIDFRRGADGTGRVIVQLTDPRTPVNVRQEGQQIVVDFAGTVMPKNLMRRYDVMDFATPVRTVDAVRVEGSSRLVISSQGDFEQLAYQSDNQYKVEIKPSTKRTAGAEEKKEYTGERFTLNFQDIDVRSVLQLLADTSGQNIVVSDSVAGNLTLRLQNVPWDQALDIVLRTKGLDKRRQDNVIIIGPTEELASREKAALAAHKEVQELSPTHTEFMQVNYAKVADLAKLIRSTNAKDSMLSPRGSLSLDERTNTLLVQDTADKLADIRRLVQTLDVPVKQVLIEARIVIVNDTFERDLGARFGVTSAQKNGSNGLFSVTGNGAGADVKTQSGIANLASTGRVTPVATPPLA